jgi:hypothetical protein
LTLSITFRLVNPGSSKIAAFMSISYPLSHFLLFYLWIQISCDL